MTVSLRFLCVFTKVRKMLAESVSVRASVRISDGVCVARQGALDFARGAVGSSVGVGADIWLVRKQKFCFVEGNAVLLVGDSQQQYYL